jgi:hypothetical protein
MVLYGVVGGRDYRDGSMTLFSEEEEAELR